MTVKVTIDPTRCRGHALCLGRAPDAFEFLDFEDRAQVRPGADQAPIEQIMAAERECPERAITVEGEPS